MLSNNRLSTIVTKFCIRARKLNISLAFIAQSYFVVPKNIGLKSMPYYIIKIPNKRELQHTAFNHSSDIDVRDFINLNKKCTAKPYSFLVIDATLGSDNPSCFRRNLLGRILKLITTSDDKTRDEKIQYDINREAPKILALSSGKNDKYEYLADEEILSSSQRRVIEQAKFTYSPLGEGFEKQIKTIEDQGDT